jgi:glycosyltransferase involved in cell wall biosynthesis
MRAIFYSPMAAQDADAASGVQRMAALLRHALDLAGVEVLSPNLPRTYEGTGDASVQKTLRAESDRVAGDLIAHVESGTTAKPDLWFSYHVYYKSPDWIGPSVSRALGIPYMIAEGSHAPKRAGGPWAIGHEGTAAALSSADRLLAMTAFDRFCLDQIAPGRVRDLKPFIDVGAFVPALKRTSSAGHLLAVAMMRNERKRASYQLLAGALRELADVPLKLSIAGDGVFRREIEAMFSSRAPIHDVVFLGAVAADRIPALMASADVFAWPGLGEAYGLAFLEAQGAGLPVVACRDRGVPDATVEGETTLLSAPGDVKGYAANLRRLLTDTALRRHLGENGRRFVRDERSVEAAARTLRSVFAELGFT